MSAHLNGYFDNITVILSFLASIFIIKNKILMASLILTFGFFIHESIFLIGFPSVFFITFFKYFRLKKIEKKIFFNFISRYLMVFLVPLISFFLITTCHGTSEKMAISTKVTEYLSQFGFIHENKNITVPKALTTPLLYYLETQSSQFLLRILDPVFLFHTGMPVFCFLFMIFNILKNNYGHFLMILFVSFLLIILPLALHAVAWDTSRIWTYPLIVGLFTLWGVCEVTPKIEIAGHESLSYLAALWIVINFQLFLLTPLMDGEQERFSNEIRVLLYGLPLLLVMTVVEKHYCLAVCCFSSKNEVHIDQEPLK